MSDQVAPKCYIYIYVHTQTQLFEVSIWGGFWRGFGEVLGRDFGKPKFQNSCVLQWFLTATIKHSLVFLGFWTFGYLKSIKIAVFYNVF